MPHSYTEEQRAFIRETAPGRYNIDIAELFNAKFHTSLTEGQIKSFKANHKIKSELSKKRRSEPESLFTEQQRDYLKSIVEGRTTVEIAKVMNEKFHLTITSRQIQIYKKNHSLKSNIATTFRKGVAPTNKGTKGLYNVGGNKTSFKKGQKAPNYKPIGTERVDRDGYLLVKVRDDGPWHKRWVHKHKVIWEEANGTIPKGHRILFLDSDRSNLSLENLQLITQSQLARLNQNNLITEDADLTRTGIIIADIYGKIGERKKKK